MEMGVRGEVGGVQRGDSGVLRMGVLSEGVIGMGVEKLNTLRVLQD